MLAPDGFEIEVTSGVQATRIALDQVLEGLVPLALDGDEISTVELVLAEVLNNIVEHAYADASGPIHIRCAHQTDGLHLAFKDRGNKMPDEFAPIGELPRNDCDVDGLPEGGFGWFLIQDLARDVKYERQGNENRLELRIAVAYGAEA